MAVLAIFTGKGFTKPMCEALRSEVKWETKLAPGGLLHACGFDAEGDLHVADVWESEEQMNEFVGTRLAPGFEKLGIPLPEVIVLPAHNVNLYPDAKRFFLK
jgi:hypothetical protein